MADPTIPTVPGVPTLRSLGTCSAAFAEGVLAMAAPGETDWFNDPGGSSKKSSAPALVFPVDGDCQLSAKVHVDFSATFDAGVLFVYQSTDDYAKLCFEYSPDAAPMVVSVVTRDTSDDANGPVVAQQDVWLRVSKMDDTIAFHHSLDGVWWHLTRLFRLRDASAATSLGFLVQAPTGNGCTAQFGEMRFTETRLDDTRNGS